MNKGILAILATTVLVCTACSSSDSSADSSSESAKDSIPKLSSKAKVVALLNSIETGDEKAIEYINPEKYIQHNPAVADGVAGFKEVLKTLPEGSAKVDIKRIYQDGNYVFTHTEYNFFGPKIGFDVFRFEDELIVEHWDNLTGINSPNPSSRTQLDGPTEAIDLGHTKQNKALVADFVNTILVKGNFSQLKRFIDVGPSDYLQHNSVIADGLSGLSKALEAMAKQGIKMVYSKNHIILGEGNFVLSISEGYFAGEKVAFYDLFRVDNGKIVEHWDIIEAIPAQEKWQNNNGKFGF